MNKGGKSGSCGVAGSAKLISQLVLLFFNMGTDYIQMLSGFSYFLSLFFQLKEMKCESVLRILFRTIKMLYYYEHMVCTCIWYICSHHIHRSHSTLVCLIKDLLLVKCSTSHLGVECGD